VFRSRTQQFFIGCKLLFKSHIYTDQPTHEPMFIISHFCRTRARSDLICTCMGRHYFAHSHTSIRLIGCLYRDAQARVALTDLIRYFSAYEWMQPNGYKITYFASVHAACVSLVQATKQELRQSQRIRWSKMRRCG
jgi:hypothetical protein